MAGDAPKQIKFVFAVDEQSARAAKRIVEDLTRTVEKLVQSAQRAGNLLGGLGGGTAVTNKAVGPGLGGVRGQLANPASRQQSGVVTAVFGSDARGIQQLGQVTQQTFQNATAGIRNFVRAAETDLQRLQRTIQNVSGAMGGLGGAGRAMGGGGIAGWGSFMPQVMAGGAPGVGPGGRNNNWSPFFNGGQIATGAAAAAGGAGGGGGGGRGAPPVAAGGFFSGARQFFGGAGGAIAGSMGYGFLQGVSTPAAAGAVGVMANNWATGAMEDSRTARLNYVLNEPIERMSRRAAMAAPFRQLYSQAAGGDVAGVHAFRMAMRRPEVRDMISGQSVQRDALARLLSGQTSNKLSAFGKSLTGMGAITMEELSNKISGNADLTPREKRTAMQIAEEQAVRNIGPEQAQLLQKAVASQAQLLNPQTQALMNRVYGGAMGRVKTMRSLGMGAGEVTLPNGQRVSAYEHKEAQLARGGWDFGDEAAGRQQILGIGAGYGGRGGVGRLELVSAGIGGLSNAADLTRAGGILGGGRTAGPGFLRGTVQRSIGAGGLDVAVGRDFFGHASQRALAGGQFGAGNTFATYAGSAAGLIGGGVGSPLDVAEQQRRMAMLQGGTAEFGGFTSGSKAPLYQMTSLLASAGAAGGYGSASESLNRMSPEVLTAIARGGAVPEWARSQGVTAEMATRFLDKSRRAPLYEVVDEMVGGDAGDLLKRVRGAERGGGSFMDVIASETEGLKGARKARKAQQLAEQLGGVLYSQGLAATPEAGAGVFMTQMQQDPSMAPFLKGKGVGAAGPKGLEKEALADQANRLGEEAREIATSVKELVKVFDAFKTDDARRAGIAGVAGAAEGQGDSATQAGQDFVAAAARVAAHLAKLEARVNVRQQNAGVTITPIKKAR